MDINEGINQEGLKKQVGVKNLQKSLPNAGRNYAARVNSLARQRMEAVRQNVGIMDMLQAVSRLKISNLPLGLRSKLIQRVMYYRGNCMWYRDFDLDRHFFLPYSLTAEDGQNLDFYGQYTRVKPYVFNGKSTDDRNATKKSGKGKEVYIGTISRIPVYDMEELDALIKSRGKEVCQKELCIIFRDYTQQMSENNIARHVTQQPFINMQAEILPILRTMMFKAAMPKLVKASDEGVVDSLLAELQVIEDSIIEGRTMIPVTAFQDLQEIDSKDAGRVIEVMAMMYEGFNNIRKTFLGIPNDGAFKKNAHILQDEQDTNQVSSDAILDDCLVNYEEGFAMVNKLYDLNVKVELAGPVSMKQAAQELDEEAAAAHEEEKGGEGGEE